MNVSIIIPVYNEEKSIKNIIIELKKILSKNKLKYEIIVVDDGSTDNTPNIVKSLKVNLITHKKNKGVGAARKTGILNAKYENIVMIDGDSTYPINAIPELLKQLKTYDLVIGYRKKEAGTFKILRKPVKLLIKSLAEFITGEKIKDLNSGLRAFKKSDILKFFNILPNTHSWVSTQVICYLSNYYTIKYIPIEYYKRKGKSTFHPIKDTYNYISLIFRTILYFSPLKIFFPLSSLVMIYGLIKALIDGIHGKIINSDIIIIILGGFIFIIGILADIIIKSTKNQYFKWIK